MQVPSGEVLTSRAGQSGLVAVRAWESQCCSFGMKMLLDDAGVIYVLIYELRTFDILTTAR